MAGGIHQQAGAQAAAVGAAQHGHAASRVLAIRTSPASTIWLQLEARGLALQDGHAAAGAGLQPLPLQGRAVEQAVVAPVLRGLVGWVGRVGCAAAEVAQRVAPAVLKQVA